MLIQIVVAADECNAIGKDNKLPWHLPNDLKFFKQKTLGHPIIMGRKTFESIGKSLPGRLNIVLSRNKIALPHGVLLQHDLEEAIAHQREAGAQLVSIVGGGEIFKQALHHARKIWFTRVHTQIENATVHFPALDNEIWEQVMDEQHSADEQHAHAYTFEEWVRRPVL